MVEAKTTVLTASWINKDANSTRLRRLPRWDLITLEIITPEW
jgi:hypothetical protein